MARTSQILAVIALAGSMVPSSAQGRPGDMQMQMMQDSMWRAGIRLQAARRAALATKARMDAAAKPQSPSAVLSSPSTCAWTYTTPFPGEDDLPPAIDGHQALLLVRRHGFFEAVSASELRRKDLVCLDLQTGKLLWKLAPAEEVVTWPAFCGDVVVFGTKDYQLVGLDRKDGSARFRVQLETMKDFTFGSDIDRVQPPVLSGDKLFVATYGKGASGDGAGKLYALDLPAGKVLWSQVLNSGASLSPLPFEDLLIVGGGRWIYGIKALDGAVAWKVQVGDGDILHPMVVSDGKVFAHGGDVLYALAARTGKEAWTAKVGRSSFVQGEADRLFYVESHWPGFNGWAVGLNAADGKQVWETKLGFNAATFWMGWWVQDGTAFFSREDDLAALNLADGKVKWRATLKGSVKGAPLAAGDSLLVATKERGKAHLHALKRADGTAAWDYEFGGSVGDGILTGGAEGILFPGKAGQLSCLR